MTIDEIKRQMFIDSEEVCGNTMIDTYQAQEYVEQAYNKAIDDCNELTFREVVYCDSLNDRTEFRELAEQLKAGGENE